jgi:hypothetical protein
VVRPAVPARAEPDEGDSAAVSVCGGNSSPIASQHQKLNSFPSLTLPHSFSSATRPRPSASTAAPSRNSSASKPSATNHQTNLPWTPNPNQTKPLTRLNRTRRTRRPPAISPDNPRVSAPTASPSRSPSVPRPIARRLTLPPNRPEVTNEAVSPMSRPLKGSLCVLAPWRDTFSLVLCAKPHVESPRPPPHTARVYNREFKGKLPEIGCCHTRSGMVCPGTTASLLYFQPLGMVG